MKTHKEIHQVLDNVIDGLTEGSLKHGTAAEISNAVGKKINLLKLQLEYQDQARRFGDSASKIRLLEDNDSDEPE